MAKEKFIEYIKTILEGATINIDGSTNIKKSDLSKVQKASRILVKQNKHFDFIELYLLVHQAIQSTCKIIERKKGGTAVSLIEKREINKEAAHEFILQNVDGYPFDYTALVSVPAINIERDMIIPVEEHAVLFRMCDPAAYGVPDRKDTKDLPELLASMGQHPVQDMCYIRINARGWAAPYERGHLFTMIVQRIKRIVAALEISGFADFSKPVVRGLSALGKDQGNEKLMVYASDNMRDGWAAVYELPYELRNCLSRLSLREVLFKSTPLLTLGRGGVELSGQEVADLKLKPYRSVMATINDDTKRINTALDWYGECLINTNETFQYILAAISLEALLGYQKEDLPIKHSLADRSAFLLGRTETKRKEIRDKVCKLYEIRSQLVHGNDSRLGKSDEESLETLKEMVHRLIRTEIDNYSPLFGS